MSSSRHRPRRVLPVIAVSALLSAAGALAVSAYLRARRAESLAADAAARLETLQRQAKTEADRGRRAREQAEELFSFILSDLRRELDPLGRTEVLEKSVSRAIEYYENVPAELRTLEGDARLGEMLQDLGVMQHRMGRNAESVATHRRSVEVREQLCARMPDRDEWQRDRARAWNELAMALTADDQLAAATDAGKRSQELCEARQGGPDDVWSRVMASAFFSQGEAAFHGGDLPGAVTLYKEGIPHAETAIRLAPDHPVSRRVDAMLVAGALYGNTGLCCTDLGRLDEAVEWCRKNIALHRAVVKREPEFREWQKELATAIHNLGGALRKQKDADGALAAYEEALAIRQGLVAWDPLNTRWLSDLTTSWNNLAHLRSERGESAEARSALEQAVATCIQGLALGKDNEEPLRDLDTMISMSFTAFPAAGRSEDLVAVWLAAEPDLAAAVRRTPLPDAVRVLADLRRRLAIAGGRDPALYRKRLEAALTDFPAQPSARDIGNLGWDFARAGHASQEPAFLELARVLGVLLAEEAKNPALSEALRDYAASGLGTPVSTLIPRAAVWRYQSGSAAPAGWVTPDFDDSAWASGPAPLGFGNGDEATDISGGDAGMSVRFRCRFPVSGAGTVKDLRLAVERDDGAVVYLNGVEIGRSGMPAGAVNAETAATLTVKDEMEESAALWYFPSLDLREGENVLAVTVHQNEPQSSDLRMTVELVSGILPPGPPDLSSRKPAEQALGAPLPPALGEWLTTRLPGGKP